jgi:hypothetical protein
MIVVKFLVARFSDFWCGTGYINFQTNSYLIPYEEGVGGGGIVGIIEMARATQVLGRGEHWAGGGHQGPFRNHAVNCHYNTIT